MSRPAPGHRSGTKATGTKTGSKAKGAKAKGKGAKDRAAGRKASKRGPATRKSEGKHRSPASPALRRRRFILVASAAFAALVLGTSFPASGLLSDHRQLTATNAAVHRLRAENSALNQEKQQLNSNAEIHNLARQDYQLVDPGQTAYNVLPPTSQPTKNSSSDVIGDPGSQPIVAPANAAGMSPDPNVPTTSTTSPAASGTQAPASSGSGSTTPATKPTTTSGGFWTRTLRSLELEITVELLGAETADRPGSRFGSDMETVDEGDVVAVTELLGRPPRGRFEVVVRAGDDAPAVIANAPFLDDGTPMPTRYWLVDPALRDAVSRLESSGGVRQAEAEIAADRVAEAHALWYAAEREALIGDHHDGPRPTGGVGGTRRGVKCLHAHLAWWLTGADDPVGAWTAARIGLHPGSDPR